MMDGSITNKRMKLKIALAVALLGFPLTAPVLQAQEHQHAEAGKEAHADHMLEGYAVVSAALSKDDLEGAKKAASGMVKHDKDSAMAKHSQAIADSKSLDEARKHFKELSDVAIPIAKAQKDAKPMQEMHCPMAFDNAGANWIQKAGEATQNPYMGTKMPHCGEKVK